MFPVRIGRAKWPGRANRCAAVRGTARARMRAIWGAKRGTEMRGAEMRGAK
jgi:hypothetical protein